MSRYFYRNAKAILSGLVFLTAATGAVRADSVYLQLERFSPAGDGTVNDLQTSADPLSFSIPSGSYGYGSASSSYADINLDVQSISVSNGPSYSTSQMYVNSTIGKGYLITTDAGLDGTGGSVSFGAQVTGSYTPDSLGSAGVDRLQVLKDGGVVATYGIDTGGVPYGPISGTLSFNYGLTLSSSGATANLNYGISALASAGAPPASGSSRADLSASVKLTGMAVYDGGGHTVNFTASSASGAARGQNVNSGETYAGFSLSNTVGKESTVRVLGGTASTARYAQASFTASPNEDGAMVYVSDTVNFGGTISDQYVLQLSFDENAVTDAGLSDIQLHLLWLDPADQIFKDAYLGDSDHGDAHQFLLGAYTGIAEFQLGNWGVDTVNHTLWAVVDHNSEFVVGSPVPEPGVTCLSLTALVLCGAIRLRRKMLQA